GVVLHWNSGYSAQDAVHDLDPDDVAVLDPADAVDPAVRQHRPQRPPVGADEHPAPGARRGDAEERGEHTLCHLLAGLAVPPGRVSGRLEACEDLVVGQAFPGPEMALTKGADRRQ